MAISLVLTEKFNLSILENLRDRTDSESSGIDRVIQDQMKKSGKKKQGKESKNKHVEGKDEKEVKRTESREAKTQTSKESKELRSCVYIVVVYCDFTAHTRHDLKIYASDEGYIALEGELTPGSCTPGFQAKKWTQFGYHSHSRIFTIVSSMTYNITVWPQTVWICTSVAKAFADIVVPQWMEYGITIDEKVSHCSTRVCVRLLRKIRGDLAACRLLLKHPHSSQSASNQENIIY
ncbi:Inositol hexakisphosphate and diphosphoinositol-pentakisphosphate kinase 2 [Desmophyllum pertusum]|uniref:Inositol hexakisphosphate and diphosphoinositol-pentakisphosphate kinase 2 n=1 Tax=Desmophyllum pertusum TaxID=174260 RepID=A0A9W9Y9G3_9CNID|nr:Inositol hexakisphosphate and diphosphoinositol-pentakisphosphate kinase 2 [Desmophyllum pertusum]